MDHQALIDDLTPYYDVELPAGRAREVAEHLSSCADCRAILESWRSIDDRIRAGMPRGGDELPARVMSALRGPGAPEGGRNRLKQLSGLAFVAAAVIVVLETSPRSSSSLLGVIIGEQIDNPLFENVLRGGVKNADELLAILLGGAK